LPFLHFFWCMAQRSLHAVTKVYYRSTSCFAKVSHTGPACSAKDSQHMAPLASGGSCNTHITQIYASPHSVEHDTLPTTFLISKQAIPYRTRGGTCYFAVSTPKIRSLVVLSTTCHDGINHLHPSNHCSNHSIDPHTAKSRHDGWKTKHSHRHKPKFNITKDERLLRLS
jgi:hypothetical protein